MKPPFARRGLTLLELLVVLFIVSLLAASAIRIMRPSLENAQVRQARKLVDGALNTAKGMAMERDRTMGVLLRSAKNNVAAATELVYVEVPPPYAGDGINSRMKIRSLTETSINPRTAVLTVEFTGGETEEGEPLPDNLVAVGDLLQLNHQGHLYQVVAKGVSGDYPTLTLTSRTVSIWPKVTDTGAGTLDPGYAFQFIRQPRPTSTTPVQLPLGAVVDLLASGVGKGTFLPTVDESDESAEVIITFNPTGQLDKVYWKTEVDGELEGHQVDELEGNVYLLVGRPEGAGIFPDGTVNSENLNNARNYWISVAKQSGLVATETNAAIDSGNVNDPDDRAAARRLAADSKGLGG